MTWYALVEGRTAGSKMERRSVFRKLRTRTARTSERAARVLARELAGPLFSPTRVLALEVVDVREVGWA